MNRSFKFLTALTLAVPMAVHAGGIVLADGNFLPDQHRSSLIGEIMKAASQNFYSVKAEQKKEEANKNSRMAILLNSVSVGVSAGKTNESWDVSNGLTGATISAPVNNTSYSYAVVAKVQLSLATWMQANKVQVTGRVQQSAMTALQIQLASEAGAAYISYMVTDLRERYLLDYDGICDRLEKAMRLPEQAPVVIDDSGDDTSADAATAKHGADMRAQVETRCQAIHSELFKAMAQKQIAEATIQKFMGDDYAHKLRAQVNEANKGAFAETLASRGNDDDYPKIDQMFPVPETAEDAMAIAQKAPALVQADLAIESAKQDWYIALAGMGPVLTLSFTDGRAANTFDYHATPTAALTTTTKRNFGDVLGLNVSVNIGAGVMNSLKADGLLEEAAQLSKQAVQAQVLEGLRKLYAQMEDSRKETKTDGEIVRQALPILTRGDDKVPGGNELQAFLQLFNNMNSASERLCQELITYINTRIQILALDGTLLDLVDQLASTEQQ